MPSRNFESVDTRKGPVDVAKEILEYWNTAGIIQESLNSNLGDKKFTFLEGPPTANGRPHVGHAMTRTFKDTVLRYKYMTGHKIERRSGGWDCHGLPVEIEAEKHFGFKTKKEIEDFGIDRFNEYCRKSIFSYIDEWMEADRKLGFWINHEKDYITLRNEYMESEWWALKQLFDRGLLIKDYKIVPYCPRCETSLSTHELSQGYDDAKDPSVFVKFRESGTTNRYFLAWTTTPWTLPSNQFLTVNPKAEYSLIRHGEEEFYIASTRLEGLFGKDYELLKKFNGTDLKGKKYDQLMDFLKLPEKCLVVVTGEHVTLDEGTGIVHTSPAFGADDFEMGKQMNVDPVNPINQSGKFEDQRLPFNGLFFKDADVPILKILKEKGLIFKSEKFVHTYPFCYRCGTPLLYYPLKAWFIKVSLKRNLLIENNQKINWMPEHLRDGRFGNFVAEAKDWALSRNRFWGTPLPVWICGNNHMKIIGSRKELQELGANVPEDLHRPFIDRTVFPCEECGKEMVREPYVIDTWFDSGSASYAAMGYPINSSFHQERDLPISFITEAIDQTRGWFYTLHVIGSLLFGKNAYDSVLSIDHILDENGRKMSKSKGNSIYALDFISEFGPDPIRMFFLTGIPWRSKSINKKLINELNRKVLLTLANVYSFFESNANLDGYVPGVSELRPLNFLDQWIVSKVNSSLSEYRERMDNYEMHFALRITQELVDNLSNFYLRLSRKRFWDITQGESKVQAYNSLYFALNTVCFMLAPMAPFFSDYIFTKLNPGKKSVHLELFPEADRSMINPEIEKAAEYGYAILENVRKMRQENNIKGRQPVKEILISGPQDLPEAAMESIADELNTRNVKVISKEKRPVHLSARLILNKAAPVLKRKTSEVADYIKSASDEDISHIINGEPLVVKGETVPPEFFEISEEVEGNYSMSTDSRLGITVFMSLDMDRDLEIEGFSREILRRIQVMRKEMDLQYDDNIRVEVNCDSSTWEKIEPKLAWISAESLALSLKRGEADGGKEWDVDGEPVKIRIEPEERISVE